MDLSILETQTPRPQAPVYDNIESLSSPPDYSHLRLESHCFLCLRDFPDWSSSHKVAGCPWEYSPVARKLNTPPSPAPELMYASGGYPSHPRE